MMRIRNRQGNGLRLLEMRDSLKRTYFTITPYNGALLLDIVDCYGASIAWRLCQTYDDARAAAIAVDADPWRTETDD